MHVTASESLQSKRCADMQTQPITRDQPRDCDENKIGSIAEWGFSFWFAVLSPFVGILLGFFGVFLLSR